MLFGRALALTGLCLTAGSAAHAQETIDLGRLGDGDITVVQQILHPKTDRTELGAHVGLMPFDAFLVTPNLQLSADLHQSETLALSVLVGGGYGIRNSNTRRLQGPTYGVAPYRYRYLASALAGVQWAPIYAKLNSGGAKVTHFDVYLAARGGVSLTRSIIPDGSFALAPTVSPAIGGRFFLAPGTALRVELRDDVLLERHALTSSWHIVQNAGITVGITRFSSTGAR